MKNRVSCHREPYPAGHLGVIVLLLLVFISISSPADTCRDDLASLGDLAAVIDSIASFELSEVQKNSQPTSTKRELQEAIAQKITDAAKLLGVAEAEIRHRILLAKQALVFDSRPQPSDSLRPADLLPREIEQLPKLSPLFVFDRILTGPTDAVNELTFSADSRFLIGDVEDVCFVHIWSLDGSEAPRVLAGHTEAIQSLGLSGDGSRIISGSDDHTVRVWDIAGGRETIVFKHHRETVWGARLSRDGKVAASLSFDRTIRIWDVDSGTQLRALKVPESTTCIELSPDAKILAFDVKYKIYLVDTDTGKRIGKPLKGHRWDIQELAFSGDGKVLVSGSRDSTVRVWDVATGKEAYPPKWHVDAIESIALSPDGKYVGAASAEVNEIFIWPIESRRRLQKLKTKEQMIGIAFSPDGKWLASGGSKVNIWRNVGAFEENK